MVFDLGSFDVPGQKSFSSGAICEAREIAVERPQQGP
jgi:hypothetical protein